MEGQLGFIKSEKDLKVLILFILRRLPEPAAREELTDMVLLCDNAISYFDFSECLMDLVRTGHIRLEDERYAATQKGRENGEATEPDLPYSVRVRAGRAAEALANIQRRRALIEATHEMRPRGGFTVRLSMSDGEATVLRMELLTGDADSSAKMEANFKENAEKIYGKIVELLLNEKDP